jgi:hypothetical protein
VLCRLHYGHYFCRSNHLLLICFFVQLYASCQLYLLSFITVQVLWVNPELGTILLTLSLFCRSKNNSSKESQVGVMRGSLCERDISPACAALQPRVWTSEYSSIWQTWIEAWIAYLKFRVSLLNSIMFFIRLCIMDRWSLPWRSMLSLEFVLLATVYDAFISELWAVALTIWPQVLPNRNWEMDFPFSDLE